MFFFYTRATDRLLGTAGGPKKTRISLVHVVVQQSDKFCAGVRRIYSWVRI